MSIDPDVAKACCVTSYSSDLVSLLLGESYHPGGLSLTRRMLDILECSNGNRLLDLASGRGTTALLAATDYAAQATGIDLAPANVALATGSAAARGLAEQVRFHTGDAESLPFPDASFDLVVCECALCTFPDKRTATREIARVLTPGGRVGITDITADRDRLPPELTSVAAWAACVADARPAVEYLDLLTDAGLVIHTYENHHAAVVRMVSQIGARLDLLRMTARTRLDGLGVDVEQVRAVLEVARSAIADGIIGYTLIVAEKPCG
jgi:hypothetical protein